jgi:hypothetical protein
VVFAKEEFPEFTGGSQEGEVASCSTTYFALSPSDNSGQTFNRVLAQHILHYLRVTTLPRLLRAL